MCVAVHSVDSCKRSVGSEPAVPTVTHRDGEQSRLYLIECFEAYVTQHTLEGFEASGADQELDIIRQSVDTGSRKLSDLDRSAFSLTSYKTRMFTQKLKGMLIRSWMLISSPPKLGHRSRATSTSEALDVQLRASSVPQRSLAIERHCYEMTFSWCSNLHSVDAGIAALIDMHQPNGFAFYS